MENEKHDLVQSTDALSMEKKYPESKTEENKSDEEFFLFSSFVQGAILRSFDDDNIDAFYMSRIW